MEEINEQILSAFGLKLKSFRKSKYMYICRTDKGTRVLRSVSVSEDKINTIHTIKEHLFRKGFSNLARYCLCEQGTPFFDSPDGTIYVMTEHLPYPEIDITDRNDIRKTVRTIAYFHKLSCFSDIDDSLYESESLTEELERKAKRLKTLKKFASNQKHLSDFDVSFIKSFDTYYSDAVDSLSVIYSSSPDDIAKKAREMKMICHNELKEDNILKAPEKLFITNFDRISFENSILDLSQFILRYIRKHGDNYLSAGEILDIYNSVNQLTENDINILYALLKFPSRYINICENYYTKKRTWTPSGVTSRFTQLIEMKKHLDEYISQIRIKK
ncbi:MAG: CotS family spore coat protein [Firmicutes bacterium]|nr:CotS family spore coat protein [Bacillota bacterium]